MIVFRLIPEIFRIAILLIAFGGFADVLKDMYLSAAHAQKVGIISLGNLSRQLNSPIERVPKAK